MKINTYFLIVLLFASFTQALDDRTLPFFQYAQYYGYDVQEHTITTQDGYVLTYHRIQNKTTFNQANPVILFQHGLVDSSDTWVVDVPMAPAFTLADQGFDVWLGNNRGNKYSLKHQTLNSKDSEYWQFTWQHMILDTKAAFIHIAQDTNKKIHYIGHSQGTSQMFAALTQNIPEINDNLAQFFALGPVVYLKNQESTILKYAANKFTISMLTKLGVTNMLGANWIEEQSLSRICQYVSALCSFTIQQLADVNADVDNQARYPEIFGHFPSGSSLLDFNHFQQMVDSPDYVFRMFDYGQDGNMKNYGTAIPPIFDLTKIDKSIKISMFVGKQDMLANVKDNEVLFSQLQAAQLNASKVELDNMGHATFIWGKNMDYFNAIVEGIKNFGL